MQYGKAKGGGGGRRQWCVCSTSAPLRVPAEKTGQEEEERERREAKVDYLSHHNNGRLSPCFSFVRVKGGRATAAPSHSHFPKRKNVRKKKPAPFAHIHLQKEKGLIPHRGKKKGTQPFHLLDRRKRGKKGRQRLCCPSLQRPVTAQWPIK